MKNQTKPWKPSLNHAAQCSMPRTASTVLSWAFRRLKIMPGEKDQPADFLSVASLKDGGIEKNKQNKSYP